MDESDECSTLVRNRQKSMDGVRDGHLVRSRGYGVDIFMRETHALCHLPWLILVSETAWRREILGVDDQTSTSLPSTWKALSVCQFTHTHRVTVGRSVSRPLDYEVLASRDRETCQPPSSSSKDER